ncbi:hypothetical protein [Methylobacterium nigriterrae]|uniref:hypothetical protein n=1 Tax=Methylobacterium nigriterrae TaxID=3127512 RepID=UPI003013566A
MSKQLTDDRPIWPSVPASEPPIPHSPALDRPREPSSRADAPAAFPATPPQPVPVTEPFEGFGSFSG